MLLAERERGTKEVLVLENEGEHWSTISNKNLRYPSTINCKYFAISF